MGEKEWKCRSGQCQCEEESLMPIVPVSLPDSQAPPPDESVGPIPGRGAKLWGHSRATSTVGQRVGPHALWGRYQGRHS